MAFSRKTILKHIFLPLAFGLGVGGFITLIFNWDDAFNWQVLKEQFVYSVILSFLFWKGCETIIRSLNKKYSWLKNTRTIVTKHILFTFGYTLLIIFLFYLYIWFIAMHRKNFQGFYNNFKVGFYICFSITAIMTLVSYSYHFFRDWKKSVLNEEKLKRESLLLQYESLKNQVNPHFLFNSFNVLTSLIERDKEASIKYVKQLSEVFRYVLDQHARELVPVDTELNFIHSYHYLQHIRFGSHFKIDIQIKDRNFLLVPLALQLLIENAVKHNEISAEYPLTIRIYDDNHYLFISNNVQPRNYLPDSNHIGLKNLDFQYEFLAGKKIEVIHTNDTFTVKIPKISNERKSVT